MRAIQTKIPYRIPLVGGFTDFPQYYTKYGGQTICCPIDRFIEVSVKENQFQGIDIQSKAELPWGIGLGSSGVFCSALVMALAKSKARRLSKLAIGRLAYQLENGIEDNATGRQDSIACLFRGISKFSYRKDDSVTVSPVHVPAPWRRKLTDRLLLFDTGERRRARDSIKDVLSRRNKLLLDHIARLPDQLITAWKNQDWDFLATALVLQEEYRSQASPLCRSKRTDRFLDIARACGAGARLAGAGLGSLLCYCPEAKQSELRQKLGLAEIDFSILW
jgi:D-glycero-alpha-D-manno-heptose-7-phosphate kinase